MRLLKPWMVLSVIVSAQLGLAQNGQTAQTTTPPVGVSPGGTALGAPLGHVEGPITTGVAVEVGAGAGLGSEIVSVDSPDLSQSFELATRLSDEKAQTFQRDQEGDSQVTADELPGLYVGQLAVEGPFYVVELTIREDGTYLFRDGNLDEVRPSIEGHWTLEGTLFRGMVEVPGGDPVSIEMDLAGVSKRRLQEGVIVNVKISALDNQGLPFRIQQRDQPYFEDSLPYPLVFKGVAHTHIEALRSEALSPQAGETVAAVKARLQDRLERNRSWDLILLEDVQDPAERATYKLVHQRFFPILKRAVESTQGENVQAYAQNVRQALDRIQAVVQRGETIDGIIAELGRD